MPPTTQAKILRVLTDQSYTRAGQRPVSRCARAVRDITQPAGEIAAGASAKTCSTDSMSFR
jgi:DNA-binding NtrC family response regulator